MIALLITEFWDPLSSWVFGDFVSVGMKLDGWKVVKHFPPR